MRRRRVAAIAATLLLGVAAVGGARRMLGRPEGRWERVRRGELVVGIEATGTLKAVRTELLGPTRVPNMWEFKISRMAPEGSAVKAGAPVLAFDTSPLVRQLEELRSSAAQAAQEIEKKRADLELERQSDELELAEARARVRKLELAAAAPPDLVSRIERRGVEIDLAVARKNLELVERKLGAHARGGEAALAQLRKKGQDAERRVREIEESIGKLDVKSPRDGTVVYLTDWQDQKKKVGDSCWVAEKVLEIPDLSSMVARGEVDEVDAFRVAPGQAARLRLDAHPEVEFTGKVSTVARTIQKQSWRNPLKVVRVEIVLDRTEPERMRPGMRFRATVETAREPSALLVPAEAIRVTPAGPRVVRQGAFGPAEVAVKLGRRGGADWEVLGGLSAGDRVLVADGTAKEGAK